MSEDSLSDVTLTDEQRRLVCENLGLVAVHLRRHVANLATPRRDREWEDLFQEGCLGLIRAAVAFRQERGIPFAAFALPRIHNAVSRALNTKFSNVYTPPRRKRVGDADTSRADRRDPNARPREYSLSDDSARHLSDRSRHDPSGLEERETVGDRLRDKYERAVHRACALLCEGPSVRGDRAELVAILERDRFLIPAEESKRPLREIARHTKSSYARVAQCNRQMGEAIRTLLNDDPEFHALQRRARSNPYGTGDPIDDELERDLAESAAMEFTNRYRAADALVRARVLDELLEGRREELGRFITSRFRSLEPDERERILSAVSRACHVGRSPSGSRSMSGVTERATAAGDRRR